MGFPVWYTTITALHVKGVWVDKISIPSGATKPIVELALLPDGKYAYVPSEGRMVETGMYAIQFVKEVLGDAFEYHYHLDSAMPKLCDVLEAWGADGFTILRLEVISEVLGFMFGSSDSQLSACFVESGRYQS